LRLNPSYGVATFWAFWPPKSQTTLLTEEKDLDDQTELPVAGEDTQDGSPDLAAAKAPSMLPLAIGLTFTIDGYEPLKGEI
jgi:hypothetical protein